MYLLAEVENTVEDAVSQRGAKRPQQVIQCRNIRASTERYTYHYNFSYKNSYSSATAIVNVIDTATTTKYPVNGVQSIRVFSSKNFTALITSTLYLFTTT